MVDIIKQISEDFEKIKGTKTEQNLRAAFSGESEARNKYTFFASVARHEGYQEIAEIFEKTSDNEKEHAKIWFKILNGIGDTHDNLLHAANGENYEHTKMYPEFARIAKEEGFLQLSKLFSFAGDVEKRHDERYKMLLHSVESGKVFSNENEVLWVCRNCGHVHRAKMAPGICPLCYHDKSFFEILS